MTKKPSKRQERKERARQRESRLAEAQRLLAAGRPAPAATILTSLVAHNPTDDLRRLLAQAHLAAGAAALAAQTWQGVEKKAQNDWLQAGWSWVQDKNWDHAQVCFAAASQPARPDPHVLYAQAVAAAAGSQYDQDWLPAVREQICCRLEQAAALPACPEAAVLWLGRIWLRAARYALSPQVHELFAQDLRRNPEHAEVRLAFTHALLRAERWAEAWAVLVSLLATADVTNIRPQAAWCAYRSCLGQGDHELALSYLDLVPRYSLELSATGKVKGDVLRDMGRLDEALACYAEEVEQGDPGAQVVGLASRGVLHLQMGNVSAAVADAQAMSSLWFALYAEERRAVTGTGIGVWVEHELELYDATQAVPELARLLLAESPSVELPENLPHQLQFIAYCYACEQDREEDQPAPGFPLGAAEQAGEPVLGGELAEHYARQKRWAAAGAAWLAYAQWMWQHGFAAKMRTPFYNHLGPGDDLTHDERQSIHTQAYAALQVCLDPAIVEAVVLHYYTDYWRPVLLLFEPVLHDECATAAQLLVERLGDATPADVRAGLLDDLRPQPAEPPADTTKPSLRKRSSLSTPTPAKGKRPKKGCAVSGNRVSISPRVRFEVFKRDSFTCQYCGRKFPDVILQVDHIIPVAEGGDNDMLNLTTACQECNAGKSDRRLDDDTVVRRQQQQLEELQARQEQMEMMLQWKRGLIDLEAQAVDSVAELWTELAAGYHLNERGQAELRRLIGKYGAEEVTEALRIATRSYLRFQPGQAVPLKESVEDAWKKVGGICHLRREQEDKPYLRQLYAIRAGLRHRFRYVDEKRAIILMRRVVDERGVAPAAIEQLVQDAPNWTSFRQTLEYWLETGDTDTWIDSRESG